jgi:hypothetical protein
MSVVKVGDVGVVCSEDAFAVSPYEGSQAWRISSALYDTAWRSGPTERLRGYHRASETFGPITSKFRNIFYRCSTHSSISMMST